MTVGLRATMLGAACLALIAVPASSQDRPSQFPDNLTQWVPATITPVFTGAGGDAWDRRIRERGWILRDQGVYHLWYTGYNDDRASGRFLGHATSPDGLRWTRDPANPLVTDSWVEDVCVVRARGLFHMFAEGKDDIAHRLTSPDGTHWTERGPLDIRRVDGSPIPPGPRGTPTVWIEGDLWYLFYERGDLGVWLATSRDQDVWTNVSDQPVLPMGPKTYDQAAVAMNQILKRDGVYYAIYHANSERPWKDWTTCVARSTDLIHWEKHPGNPIVGGNCSSGIVVDGPQGAWLFTMHPEVRPFQNPDRRR